MSRLFYLLFSFEGRIARLSFVLGSLVQIVLVGAALATLVFSIVLNRNGHKVDETLVSLWALPIFVFAIWSALALSAKRLHDRDLSGMWSLVTLIPVFGTLWWLLQTVILKGDSIENRYGMPQDYIDSVDEEDFDDLGRRIGRVSTRAARYADLPDIVREAREASRSRIQTVGRPQNTRAQSFGRRGPA